MANKPKFEPRRASSHSPEHFLNRELQTLEFNRRVLAQAEDKATPALERLRFLCIVSSNMDEFFEIRVAGVKEQLKLGAMGVDPDGLTPREIFERVTGIARALVERQYALLNDAVLPALAAEGIRFLRRGEWTSAQQDWVRDFFFREMMPVLTPIGLDPSHPFPRVFNKSLNFAVELEGRDAFGRDSRAAIVQAPRVLPRVIRLPRGVAEGDHDFTFLTSILHAHVGELFAGMGVRGCHQFRVTRNSDLFVEEEEVKNLKKALQGELPQRHLGDAVRLEVDDTMTEGMASLPAGAARARRRGSLPRERSGEPRPDDERSGPGRPRRPQVRAVPARPAEGAREVEGHLRNAEQGRRPAAPSLPVVRAGDRFHPRIRAAIRRSSRSSRRSTAPAPIP